MFDRLNFESRSSRFGVIAKIKFDTGNDPEEIRTKVYCQALTPNKDDYLDLIKSGEWFAVHSSDPNNKKWEWGTLSDYLGQGVKLLLFCKIEKGITIIADINPNGAFFDDENHHTVRNVMTGKPHVLEKPIPTKLIIECGLKGPLALGLIPFEEITEKQYEELMRNYDN